MKAFFSVIWLSLFAVLLSFLIGCFYGYFYPMKYENEIKLYSQQYEVDSALVASIINVESSYNPLRVSSKGAVGLMQLLPSTGEWIAEHLGEDFFEDCLKNPDINIKYGSFYISYLINYFQNIDNAIYAYNAGMGNVKAWLKNEEYTKDGVLIKIPFAETENYYIKVSKNLRYYKKKYA